MDLFGFFRSWFIGAPLDFLPDDDFPDLRAFPVLSGHAGRGQPPLPVHRSAGGRAHSRWRKRRSAGRA